MTKYNIVQTCTDVRPADDEELPSAYIEEYRYAFMDPFWSSTTFLLMALCHSYSIKYKHTCHQSASCTIFPLLMLFPMVLPGRCALDGEIMKYVGEAYPKGVCSVYCINGKDVEEPGSNFELVVVISASRLSPQNFW